MMDEDFGEERVPDLIPNVNVVRDGEPEEREMEGEEGREEPVQVGPSRDVLPYENWAVAVGGRRVDEDPLPENLIHVMSQVFHNDMLVEHILEKVILSKERVAIRNCRLVSKQWTIGVSRLYKRMKKPLFLVNTNKDLFPHNDPPRPIFDHHSVLCEFLRPMTRPGRIEGFIPTFALHLAPHYFRKCNYTDFVNCLVQCGSSLVELVITFPKNSQMSFLLPPGISFPNLTTMGVCFSGVTLHSSLYGGPFGHNHEYYPNHGSIHLVQSILNAASNLRSFTLMRCQNPCNPPDLEHLHLPDKLVSMKVDTPLRGFELLLRKHFDNLAELTLNASLVLYSEGEIYELLSKLSSKLRALTLAGTATHAYRQSLPVKLPRMESLTKFSMFKPWEFEVRNPPLSFEEILPKMETLVFAIQTESSFSYLMSGMRSSTVTSFSVWLTSLGSYRQPQVAGGFINMMDGNRVGPNPLMMVQRIDLDLLPPRAEQRFRALRLRRNIEERNRRFPPNMDDIQRLDEVLLPLPLPPPRVVGPVAGPRDHLNPAPAVLADLDNRADEQHILRMRRERVRMAHNLQRRMLIEHQQQQQRRRELLAREQRERDVLEPRVVELRRRLQVIRGRLDLEGQQRARERWRRGHVLQLGEAHNPEIRIEVVPNGPAAEQQRRHPGPGPHQVDIMDNLNLSSTDSDDDDDDDDELNGVIDMVPPLELNVVAPPAPEDEPAEDIGRLQPLQVLAAAAVIEEDVDRMQVRVRQMVNNYNEAMVVNEAQPPQDNQNPQEPVQIEDVDDAEDDANNANQQAPRQNAIIEEREEERNDEGAGEPNLNNEIREEAGNGNADAEFPHFDLMELMMRRNGLNEHRQRAERLPENAAAANLNNEGAGQRDDDARGIREREAARPGLRAFRRIHNQLLEQYQRRRPARQPQLVHLLPDRPVTMTKDKMTQINVAFINLTKLKINICGPDICGLKYIFEEMKSLQILKIVVEKSLWPIKWDSVLTGIPTDFCEAVKSSTELWDEVYLHENQVSIRSLAKLEELALLECLKVNETTRQDGPAEDHLISDVAFHFALLKMKNLKHLVVTPGFSPSPSMFEKWYKEKGYSIKTQAVGRMDAEYEE